MLTGLLRPYTECYDKFVNTLDMASTNRDNRQDAPVYLSVIIPFYNSRATLVESLKSVILELKSLEFTWEIILVDDGSQDDSRSILQDFIHSSPFKANLFLYFKENGGVASARNLGLIKARGEIIAFNDSDDKWIRGKVSSQLGYLFSHKDVQMVGGVFGSDNLSAIPGVNVKETMVVTIRNQVLKNYFSPQTVMFRREVLAKVGLFDDTMRYAEEGYFFNRMVYYFKCVIVDRVVAEPLTQKRRWGDAGLSGNLVEMEKGELHNIANAFSSGYIGFGLLILAVSFSILKFFRRLVLSKILN